MFQFRRNFRVTRAVAGMLIERFQGSAYYENCAVQHGFKKLTAEEHVLSFLWFVYFDKLIFKLI